MVSPKGGLLGNLKKNDGNVLLHGGRLNGILERTLQLEQRHHNPTRRPSGDTLNCEKLRAAQRQRFQKLRCGWLQVNMRVAREDPDRSPFCPACLYDTDETIDHIIQCTSREQRTLVQDALRESTTTFREWKTSKHLIQTLLAGTLAWSEESLDLPQTPLGLHIKQAYVEQTQIGWGLLFRGFWTVTWRLAQEEQYRLYSQKMQLSKQDTSKRLAEHIQHWFFVLFEDIWKVRNATQHGADPETQRRIRLQKCDRTIRRPLSNRMLYQITRDSHSKGRRSQNSLSRHFQHKNYGYPKPKDTS